MGTKLTAGNIATNGELTAGSMARAIEDAMTALVPYGAAEDPAGRRKLFVAIARGVCRHIRDNPRAIVVTLESDELVTSVAVDMS